MHREAILEEILQYNKRPQLREDEVLVKEYLEAWNADSARSETIGPDRARKDLDRMVRDGIIEKRVVFHDGHWVNAYSKKEA